MWIKDPKTGKPSVTLTVFIATFLGIMSKLLPAGIEIKGIAASVISFPAFDYSGAGLLLGAAGAIYFGRKNTDKDKK